MKFSFALCGYGHIGRRHAQIIAEREDADLIAVIETDARRAEEAQNTYGVPVFDSLRTMTGNRIHPEVVVLAVPNNLHIKMGRAALRLGAHLLIEKPMGLRYRDARRLLDLAREKDRRIACVLQNRFSPIARWLHEVITSGRLGTIHHVDVRLIWNRNEAYYRESPWRGTLEQDGGTLYTQFSHFLDLLYWCFGPIAAVTAWTDNVAHPYIEIEDIGAAEFRFSSGPRGRLLFSTTAYDHNLESSITVLGTQGMVQIAGQYFNKVLHWAMEDPLPPPDAAVEANHYGHYQGSGAFHAVFYDHFLRSLRGQPHELAPVQDAAELILMIEQIYQAAARRPLPIA